MNISHLITMSVLFVGTASASLAGPGTGYTRGMGANQPASTPDKSACGCCVASSATATPAPVMPPEEATPAGKSQTQPIPVQDKGDHSAHTTPRA